MKTDKHFRILLLVWVLALGSLICFGQNTNVAKPQPNFFSKNTPVAAIGANQNAEEEEGESDEDAAPALPPLLPITPGTAQSDILVGLKYENIDVDEVLKQYSDWTGLALMKDPKVPTTGIKITLKCPKRLPKKEALLAIESVLAMNGIGLVPMGDKFLKVVAIGTARTQGMKTERGELAKNLSDTDHLISGIVELKNLEISEAQTAIQGLLHDYAKVIPLERINSLLITETANNLKQILAILDEIEKPVETREELRIFKIKYAKASEIQSKIESIIADVQAKETKTRLIRQQLTTARMPFQPVQPAAPSPAGGGASETSSGALDRSLIQSRVKMVADDRINSLIVVTRKEQFSFMEDMIKALDQKVEPDTSIKVITLEYAESKDVMGILNNLLASSSSAAKSGTTPALPQPEQSKDQQPSKPGEKAREAKTETAAGETQISGKLSAEVKIISDQRINALLIMACKADLETIEKVISQVDIMLSQVLIEVVIIEVNLTDQFKMGIDWLQRSMIAYNKKQGGGRHAVVGFAGSSRAGTDGAIKDGASINQVSDNPTAAGSGLTYYFTFFDYNIDAVLNMLASTSDARILATPVVMTTDNTDAQILIGEKRPVVTGTSISSATQQSTYQYVDIGINLKVTPHINQKGFVVMEIEQKVDDTSGDVTIDGNPVPVITTRDFNASISVNDGRTVVIGGIVQNSSTKTRTKIPFLGDIPLLGMLFRSDDNEEKRTELMVMITPYVLDTPEEAYGETARRHASITSISNMWVRGWSASDLASPSPEEIKATKAAAAKRGELETKEETIQPTKNKYKKSGVLKQNKYIPKADMPSTTNKVEDVDYD